MYCDKLNINILTALLVTHGVRHCVVCPGSRNGAIVHNLNECPDMACYPVTDERSAGFYALGMAQALQQPVAVCVTSGTALLNLAPAVSEAFYQHIPLVVLSADRPMAWIGQLDGQTLPQVDVFHRFTLKSVTLPEPHDETETWYCNRLVNESLLAVTLRGGGPVHINIPISKPLFNFTISELPPTRTIQCIPSVMNEAAAHSLVQRFLASEHPLLVIGQLPLSDIDLRCIPTHVTLFHEALSFGAMQLPSLSEIDFVIYIGGCIVNVELKKWLRQHPIKECWAVTPDGEVHDTFQQQIGLLEADPLQFLRMLTAGNPVRPIMDEEEMDIDSHCTAASVVSYFEQQMEDMEDDYSIHYGNSTAVRLANRYARHHVYCNRGVNGIEGSLSTAAGFSVVSSNQVFCVLGDLSFFYDQNALWNQNLKGNLRIILLNSGGGDIFNQLPGLKDSPASMQLVAGVHHTDARGICTQNDIGYLCATNVMDMQMAIVQMLTETTSRPMLLEVKLEKEGKQ